MTISDLIKEAGGFTEGGSAQKIELSRRIKSDTLATTQWQSVKIYEYEVDELLRLNANDAKYILQPFDIVTVRKSPKYEVQQSLFINGEVAYPGNYVLKDKEERISDIIKRSGGLRPSAFLKGATIQRDGRVVSINFRKAIDNPESLDNILLLQGDSINIPRYIETVKIGERRRSLARFRTLTRRLKNKILTVVVNLLAL